MYKKNQVVRPIKSPHLLHTSTPLSDEEVEAILADFDPLEELERTHKNLLDALQKIEALAADDPAKELAKTIDLNQVLEVRLHQEMAKAATMERALRYVGKQHAEIRKVLGIDDDRQLVAIIKRLKNGSGS